jgi:hypothetical protein
MRTRVETTAAAEYRVAMDKAWQAAATIARLPLAEMAALQQAEAMTLKATDHKYYASAIAELDQDGALTTRLLELRALLNASIPELSSMTPRWPLSSTLPAESTE